MIFGYVIRLVPVCDSQKVTGPPLAQFINTNISKVNSSVEGNPAYVTNLNECKPFIREDKPNSYGMIGSTKIKGGVPINSNDTTLKNIQNKTGNSKPVNQVANTFNMRSRSVVHPKVQNIKVQKIVPAKPQIVVQQQKPQKIVQQQKPQIVVQQQKPQKIVQQQKPQIVVQQQKPQIVAPPVVLQPKVVAPPPQTVPIYQPVYPIIIPQNSLDCSKQNKLQFCPPVKKKSTNNTVTKSRTYVGGSANLGKTSSSISSYRSSSSTLIDKSSEKVHESLEDSSLIKRAKTTHIEIEDSSSFNFIELRNFCNMNIEPQIRECEKYKLSSFVLDTDRLTVSYHVIGQILHDKGIRVKDLVEYIKGSTVEDLRRLNETINRAFNMSKKLKENEKVICSVSSKINVCYTALYKKNSDDYNIQHRKSRNGTFDLNEKTLEDTNDHIQNIVTIGTKNKEVQEVREDISSASKSEDISSASKSEDISSASKSEDISSASKSEDISSAGKSENIHEDCLKIMKMSDLVKGNTFDPCLDFFKHRINQISKGDFAYCSMMEPRYRENGDSILYLSELF
ncbi:hypothetical protein P3W45_000410 [Vairimorpha bombi]